MLSQKLQNDIRVAERQQAQTERDRQSERIKNSKFAGRKILSPVEDDARLAELGAQPLRLSRFGLDAAQRKFDADPEQVRAAKDDAERAYRERVEAELRSGGGA